MSFELDKLAEEVQQIIKQGFLDNQSTNIAALPDSNLTAAETQDLNQGLSGEVITAGFTEKDAENLMDGLSGENTAAGDSVVYSKTDENGIKQNVNFYGQEREGFLDLTQDSIDYYINKYPNVAKAYLKSGIVFLLDKQGNIIKDSLGNPITVNYNQGIESKIDLVSFYLNHTNGEFDVNKMLELQKLQDSANLIQPTAQNYQELMSEIEVQKLEMMSEDERKNNITTKMWNAYNKGDKAAWFNALSEFYDFECRTLDKKLGITTAKDFIKDKTHLHDLIAYIDKVLDDNTDKLTKTELAWEIIKGVGDAIDSFIGTQGLTMMGALGAGTKAASAIPKIGTLIAGAIQAYFGTEGAVLIGSGMIDGYNAETKEQARASGAELGLGGIMAKGGLKSFKEGFKNLELKQFRSKIGESTTMEELDVIREIIEESSYTKAEKQMLQNECSKQQGMIQSNWKEVKASMKDSPLNDRTVVQSMKDQKTRSQLAYDLFKVCKTPHQRELANLVLSDKRLYLSKGAGFSNIIKNCTSQESVNMYMQFFSKLLSNPKFLNNSNSYSPDGTVNEFILTYAIYLKPEFFDTQMKILDAYAKNNIALSQDDFGIILVNSVRDFSSCTKFLEFLQNENFYKQELTENLQRELRAILKYDTDISLEKIYSFYDVKNLASTEVTNDKVINLRNQLLHDETLYQKAPIHINDGTVLSNYSDIVRSILYSINYITYDFAEKILLNETLRKDSGVIGALRDILHEGFYKKQDYLQTIEEVLQLYQSKEIAGFTSDKLGFISECLYNEKDIKGVSVKDRIISNLKSFDKIYTAFTTGREYSSEDVTAIGRYINQNRGCPRDIVEEMCINKDYTAQNIRYVASRTNEKNVDFTRKILKSNKLTSEEKINTIKAIGEDVDLMKLASILLEYERLDMKSLSKILEATKIMDEHDAGGNNGKVDPKKVDKYLRLLQSPKTRDWTVQMLNEGWDIETISRLSATKQNFYTENKATAHVTDENVKYFMDFGLNEKEAESIVKSISQSGAINTEMQNTAVDLINAGIPKNKIGQILSSATITGEYNARVPADAMALNGLGLNAFVERFLPVVNNLSPQDVAVKFNSKTREQLKTMISNIPESTKPALRAKGFDLEGILEKLGTKGIVRETKNGKPQKVLSGLRNRSDITGFERMLIEKFNPVESVWRNPNATKEWAETKYNSYKKEYKSTRISEGVNIEEVNKQRAEGLKIWFDYMDNEPELKNNPFARVLLSEFITRDLLPENSSVPPVLDKALVKKVLAEALEKGSSFEKGYKAELNNSAKQSLSSNEVEIGGRKMTWFTVPQTDSSHPDFNSNVAKVRALSDGTNWCIRTWNAEPYVQKGNIHVLVDETGMAQVCIREDGKRHIAEIQKRQQTQSVPVAYVDFIKDFVGKKKLKGCESNIKEVLKQKPEFDKTRGKLQELANKKDYKAILEMMGIEVKVLPDGSWEISKYSSYLNDITLNDYGIKENDLLANVSKIKGDAKFKDSNATSLPRLEEVGGELDFGYSNITNMQNLKKIKDKEINWNNR